jgi:hypothetical protein
MFRFNTSLGLFRWNKELSKKCYRQRNFVCKSLKSHVSDLETRKNYFHGNGLYWDYDTEMRREDMKI